MDAMFFHLITDPAQGSWYVKEPAKCHLLNLPVNPNVELHFLRFKGKILGSAQGIQAAVYPVIVLNLFTSGVHIPTGATENKVDLRRLTGLAEFGRQGSSQKSYENNRHLD